MANVYKNAVTDENLYAEDGWELMPMTLTRGKIIVFKDIRVGMNDDLVKGLIDQYETEDWQKHAMGISKFAEYYNKIGYHFVDVTNADTGEKRKRLDLTEEAIDHLTTWRVEMDFSDGYLRISPFDVTFPYSFYNTAILDKYAPEIVASLREKGLVECATI